MFENVKTRVLRCLCTCNRESDLALLDVGAEVWLIKEMG